MSEDNTSAEALTAEDVLCIMIARAQWCREEGESDMRNIIHTASAIRSLITQGKSRTEILACFEPEEDDEDEDE